MTTRDKTLATMFVEALDKRVEVEGGKTSRRVLVLEKIIEKADAGDIKCQKLLLAFMETPAASSPDSLIPTDPKVLEVFARVAAGLPAHPKYAYRQAGAGQ